jgi:arylsulfatase A-like enzyme
MDLKRNLVIVLCHGLRSDALADSRAWPLSTPSLQKLSERGVRLNATSACPADVGGLVSLLTGLHARQHGYVDQVAQAEVISELTSPHGVLAQGWPAQLAESGYHVAGVGLVGLIEPWLHEVSYIDSVESLESAKCRYLGAMREKGYEPAILQQRRQRLRSGPFEPDRLIIDTAEDIDGFIWLEARQMLDRLPEDKPWALIVVTSGPGNDLPPPTLYDYVVATEALERGFTIPDFNTLDLLAELDYPRSMFQRLEPHQIGRIRADYLGRTCLLDQMISQLMGQLEDRGDGERTWVVLTSDRGQVLGEHGVIGHRSFLAGAVGVPVIISPPAKMFAAWKALRKTQLSTSHIDTVDVAATIAALAGCDMPKASVGKSFLSLFAGEPIEHANRPGVLSEFANRLMIRTDTFKAVFDTGAFSMTALYDVKKDPDERHNLARTTRSQDVPAVIRFKLGEMLMPLRSPVPTRPA